MTQSATCLRPGGLELTDRLLAAACLPAGAAVLDVGCGAGATVAHLADRHGLRATGVDASCERVERAASTRPDLVFVGGRAEALPFPAATFTAVLCECVLSTLDDAGAALREMVRVLRPGGLVLLSDVYVAEGDEASPPGRRAALGRRGTVEGLLTAAGLSPELWEDHAEALGSYLWGLADRERAMEVPLPPRPRRVPTPGRRLSYCICTARRR
jgi:arsenite methyltransferase